MRVLEHPGPPGGGRGTLLLLHGFTSTAAMNWFNVIAPLGEHYRVIAPDLRGHGRGARDGVTFGLERIADDMDALLGALDAGDVIVVGYSMGGAIATLLWRRHPARVAGLVLCASACRFNVTGREHLRFLGLRAASFVARLFPERISRDVAMAVFRHLYGDDGFQRWVQQEIAEHSWPRVLDLGAALGRFDGRAWTGEVDVPAASVVTTADTYIPPARQYRLAARTGAARYEIDGDHAVCLSDGPRFAETLLAAVDDVHARATGGTGTEIWLRSGVAAG
jgi:3-oxoadipate enol-lactonase